MGAEGEVLLDISTDEKADNVLKFDVMDEELEAEKMLTCK